MPNIVFNLWNGGMSSHYHTGAENTCADSKNIDMNAHPDAIMLANAVEKTLESQGKITAGVNMKEHTKHATAGMLITTDAGEIFYKNEKILSKNGRKFLQVFFDGYTENNTKKLGIFIIHKTGVDRMQYNKNADTFYGYEENISGSSNISASGVEKIPILRWNTNVLLGINNEIIEWDGIMFAKKIKMSDITRIVGMTAYGDYVHIYATDGETSYKAIYDPVNDDKNPSSLRNFGRMEFVSVIEYESVDLVVTDNDEIYQSSGLQIQKYLASEKDIFREDKDYNSTTSSHNGKIYIGGKKYLYLLTPEEIGLPPKISKWDLGGEINFLLGSKNEIWVGYKNGEQNYFGKISSRAGENIAENGEYMTLWRRVTKYASLTGVNIEINTEGKSGGSAEIWVRTDMAMEWIEIGEYTENKWVQEMHKSKVSDKLKNWHEIQAKIILKKSSDGKSPILYTLTLEYDNSNI